MTHWLQLNVSGHCRIHALPNTKGTSDYTLQSVLYFNFIWRKREAVTFKKRNFTSTTHQKEAADLHLILIVSEGLSEAPSYRDQRKRECVSLWFIQMSHSSGGDASARGIKLHSNELLTGLKHLEVMGAIFCILKHLSKFNVQRQHWLNQYREFGAGLSVWMTNSRCGKWSGGLFVILFCKKRLKRDRGDNTTTFTIRWLHWEIFRFH